MKIIDKKVLGQAENTRTVRLEVVAPDIARRAKPGQFVVLMVSPEGERIPLTIVDRDTAKGTIVLIFQELGLTTKLLGKRNAGDSLFSLVGPLGHATEIKNYGKVAIVGGGVGVAEIYPVAKALRETGNHVVSIIGARTKDLLILENEMKSASNDFFVTTDDGSYGRKGFTTDALKEVLAQDPKPNLVYAVGPLPMMRRIAEVAKSFGVRTIVSLNALMIDGTGMCGGCRVTVGGKAQFTCVDGPEFDADLVDWAELAKRNQVYAEQEKHICRLFLK